MLFWLLCVLFILEQASSSDVDVIREADVGNKTVFDVPLVKRGGCTGGKQLTRCKNNQLCCRKIFDIADNNITDKITADDVTGKRMIQVKGFGCADGKKLGPCGKKGICCRKTTFSGR